jgi:hypothetical protein
VFTASLLQLEETWVKEGKCQKPYWKILKELKGTKYS